MNDRTRTLATPGDEGRAGPAYLEVVSGSGPTDPVPLDRAAIVIGRAEDADLRVSADGVSRKHAKVAQTSPGRYSLIDLGAKNGTFLNGERIDVAPLRPGDRIQIGQVVLRFGPSTAAAASDKQAFVSARRLLSARELEVAELVAQGLTNPEIGERLGITRRTVATHLEHAYERLNIHSRAELVRRIAEG